MPLHHKLKMFISLPFHCNHHTFPTNRPDTQYRHTPDQNLNSRLNVVVALTLACVLGLGLGHFLGESFICPLVNLLCLSSPPFVCLSVCSSFLLSLCVCPLFLCGLFLPPPSSRRVRDKLKKLRLKKCFGKERGLGW